MEEQNLNWEFKSATKNSISYDQWIRTKDKEKHYICVYKNLDKWYLSLHFKNNHINKFHTKLYGHYYNLSFDNAHQGMDHMDNFLKQYDKLKVFI